jgi:hypothetical protein
MSFEFEYLGKIEFIFEQNFVSESWDQGGSFDEKKTKIKNLMHINWSMQFSAKLMFKYVKISIIFYIVS